MTPDRIAHLRGVGMAYEITGSPCARDDRWDDSDVLDSSVLELEREWDEMLDEIVRLQGGWLNLEAEPAAFVPAPARRYDDFGWDEQNGWYALDEDDPATGTETKLLDEIVRLRELLAIAHRFHPAARERISDPYKCRCGLLMGTMSGPSVAAYAVHLAFILDGPTP